MSAPPPTSTPSAVIQAANDIMDRLDPLDETIVNAIGFRALLEDLHGRDLSTVREPHIGAIDMARAAIIRAAIGTIMDAVDRCGTDRASIGQVVHMFEGMDLSVLASVGKIQPSARRSLSVLRTIGTPCWQPAIIGIARNLETVASAIPSCWNSHPFRTRRISSVLEAAENITRRFYLISGYGKPDFPEHRSTLIAKAKVFWDTYFKGMGI